MKIKTIHIFDSEDDFSSYSNNSGIDIFLDSEQGRIGKNNFVLKGQSISQFDAILEAEKIYSSVRNNIENSIHRIWYRTIEPQVILYIISKIIRSQNVLDRINHSYPGKKLFFTSNPIIKALSKKKYTTFKGRKKFYFKEIMIDHFPFIFSKYRFKKLNNWKRNKVNKIINESDILIHGENIVYQKVCNEITQTLSKTYSVKTLVSNQKPKEHQFDINSLMNDELYEDIKDLNKDLFDFFDVLSNLLAIQLKSPDYDLKIFSKLIYKELFNLYAPQLSQSYVLTKNMLELSTPKIVIINDLVDMKPRMFAILSRIMNIKVLYLQFGQQGYYDIQLKGDYADKYLLWSSSQKIVFSNFHNINDSNISVVGSPVISQTKNIKTKRKSKARKKKSIFFPLVPSSPLTFGNGGAYSTFQCRSMFRDIINSVAKNSEHIELIVKPRPLLDNEWANYFLKNEKDKMRIVDHKEPIDSALNDIDALITSHSTVGLDALNKNIPLIIYDPFMKPNRNDYIFNKVGLYVSNHKELNETFKKIINEEDFLKNLVDLQHLKLKKMMAFSGSESKEKIIFDIEESLRKYERK